MAGGDSPPAAVAAGTQPPLLALGVPRAQPVPPSSTSGRPVRPRSVFPRSRNTRHTHPPQEGSKGAGEKGLSMRRSKRVTFPYVFAPAGVSSEKYWVTLSTHLFCN